MFIWYQSSYNSCKLSIILNKEETDENNREKYEITECFDKQLTQDGISWCSFNVEGCVLNINLTETIKTDKETRENPCNIKAVVDGKSKPWT